MNSAVTLTKHALCILLLSKKDDNFFCLPYYRNKYLNLSFSNSVLMFSSELDKFCFTREHSLSIRQKFKLKICYAVVNILKIPANNDLLRFYCHSNLQQKKMDT